MPMFHITTCILNDTKSHKITLKSFKITKISHNLGQMAWIQMKVFQYNSDLNWLQPTSDSKQHLLYDNSKQQLLPIKG